MSSWTKDFNILLAGQRFPLVPSSLPHGLLYMTDYNMAIFFIRVSKPNKEGKVWGGRERGRERREREF